MKKKADRKFRGATKGAVPMALMKRMAGSSPSAAAEGGVTGAKKYASGGSVRGYGISKKIKPSGPMC